MFQLKFMKNDIISNKDNKLHIILDVNENIGEYIIYPMELIDNRRVNDISTGNFVYQGLPTQIEVKVPMLKKINVKDEVVWKKVTTLDLINNICTAYETISRKR